MILKEALNNCLFERGDKSIELIARYIFALFRMRYEDYSELPEACMREFCNINLAKFLKLLAILIGMCILLL